MPHARFSYPADVPRRGWLACFSYSVDPPLRVRNHDAAQPTEPGLLHCFSYSVGAPLGVRNRYAAPSVLPSLRSMTFGTCFRY
jgi:hypothetical protein